MSSDVTRRESLKFVAAGVAGAAVGAVGPSAAAGIPPASGHIAKARAAAAIKALARSTPPAATLAAIVAEVDRLDRDVVVPEGNPVCLAAVLHCRSWQRQVYLYISESVRGFVGLGPEGFALAAACQAAGRHVAVRYFGHQPAAHRGAGRFAGAVVAIDPSDLGDPSGAASAVS